MNVIPGEGGGGGGRGGDFDKAFMPEGVAFDFMDLPQGAGIWCLEWIALPLGRNIWHTSPALGWGFLCFLTKYVVPGEWFLTKSLEKMSKSPNPARSPPPPPRDNIERCIIKALISPQETRIVDLYLGKQCVKNLDLKFNCLVYPIKFTLLLQQIHVQWNVYQVSKVVVIIVPYKMVIIKFYAKLHMNPGVILKYFNDRGEGGREGGRGVSERGSYSHVFYIPTSEFVYPKKIPTLLAHPKKSHTSSKLHSCYCWFELMENTIPKKYSISFIDPKNSFWPKFQTPKIPLEPPPSVKYVNGAPGECAPPLSCKSLQLLTYLFVTRCQVDSDVKTIYFFTITKQHQIQNKGEHQNIVSRSLTW